MLHHERHAWLYDLVVDEPHHGADYGTALLEHAEAWADDRGCASVALASPLATETVHDYYDRRGYEKWRYVVETAL